MTTFLNFERLENRTHLSAQPVGPEIALGTAWLRELDAASDADGNFTITWAGPGESGNPRTMFRRYDATGRPLGDVELADGVLTQRRPSIAMQPSGAFVLAWDQSWSPNVPGTHHEEVFARMFSPSGEPLGPTFHVNQYTTDRQVQPSVAMDDDGDFVISWQSNWQDGFGYGVYARRYNAAGDPLGDEFRVNQTTDYRQQDASVAMNADGQFVVVWDDWSTPYIKARSYAADGTPMTDETVVGSGSIGRIAARPDGNFLVHWYDRAGAVPGPVVQVYTPELELYGKQKQLDLARTGDLAVRGDGGFVVTYSMYDAGNKGAKVYVREFDSDGKAIAGPYLVSSIDAELYFNVEPRVAINPDGDYVVAWYVQFPAGQSDRLFAHRYGNSPVAEKAEFISTTAATSFPFSENVSASLSPADLHLVNLTTGKPIDPSKIALAWDPATFTATFTFPGFRYGALPDGRYRATLAAADVTDPGGNQMQQDATLDFFVLAGDANRDAAVNQQDLQILATNWQQSGRTFSQGDFTYDGSVDISDLAILATNWQTSVSAPPVQPVLVKRITPQRAARLVLAEPSQSALPA